MGTKLFFLLTFTLIQLSSSANILVYVILGGYSHRLSMMPLVEELADQGHNVTFVSSYPHKTPHPKIHDYVPKLWQSRMGDWSEHMDFYDFRQRSQILRVWTGMPAMGTFACETLYEDDEFVHWLRNVDKFDLIIVDTMMNECVYGMSTLWNSKIIVYSTANTMGWFQDSYGMPDETSFYTDPIFSWQLGHRMSFPQRFINAMTPLVWKLVREFSHFPELEEITKRGLKKVTGKDVDIPSFTAIERNVSLVMVSSHHSLSFPRSLPPNMVPVGGVTIQKELKPLPGSLKEFIGHDDFIYVSLGSVAEFTQCPLEVQKKFIAGLAAFPNLKMVWKLNKEISLPIPKNVKIVNWAPQVALLAHPNIKGFVTHAGLGSTTEAVVSGVPVVIFPILGEQDMNAAVIAERGAGIKLEITDFTSDEFANAIKEVLENPKYRKEMKTLQAIFKDRPMPPIQSALWWVEFVLRHDNFNTFLQPGSVHQSWWVKRQIDVWLVLVILVVVVTTMPIFILYRVTKRMLSRTPRLTTGSKDKHKKMR